MNMKKIFRKVHILDAADKSLGRLASQAAQLLRGKHKVSFVMHLDLGDKVVIKNAGKLKFDPKKLATKIYYKHTGYMGHLKKKKMDKVFKDKPEEVVLRAIKGMIPSNKLKNNILKRLKVHA